jgi:hypothetical protein
MMETDLSMDDLLSTMQDFVASVTFVDGETPKPGDDPDDDDPEFAEPVSKDEVFYPRGV